MDHDTTSEARAGVGRRAFLQAGALAGLAVATPRGVARVRRGGATPERARNVILMVSDGMSTGTLTLAHMAKLRREGRPSAWVALWARPGVRRAMATTFAADSLVTDSAAAATAWGSGRTVNFGQVNVTPEGLAPTPILPHAAQQGKATGLVTTTRITHATPAGFVANVPTRGMEKEIAAQILERGVDVALGGGARSFPAELLAAHGEVEVVRTSAALRGAEEGKRLLGLFAASHLPFEIDRPDEVPSLREMARVALSRLARSGREGFVLQVEGGRVDHAAHSNDAGALVGDQLAFDEAIEEVLSFVEGRDDTLVIVTTDHGNANPGLTMYQERGNEAFGRLLNVGGSFEEVERRFAGVARDDAGAEGRLRTIVEEVIGVRLSEAEMGLLMRAVRRERVALFGDSNHPMTVLGGLLTNHLGVGFASGNHTADLVEVTAFGPGSEGVGGLISNTDLHGVMVGALGLGPAERIRGQAERVEPVRTNGSD